MDRGDWWAAVHGVARSRTGLSDFTFTFHLHASEKEMATHSSILAWRIPGKGEPGQLPSMGSHRVGHDWSDLAAAAAAGYLDTKSLYLKYLLQQKDVLPYKQRGCQKNDAEISLVFIAQCKFNNHYLLVKDAYFLLIWVNNTYRLWLIYPHISYLLVGYHTLTDKSQTICLLIEQVRGQGLF